jgi:hypothetical protein
MKIIKIDPNIRLSSVPLFRLIAIALPLLALISIVVIVLKSNLTIELSFEGFNFGFFTVFRVPLAILAACITVLGVIAAIHRSAQTTLQIEKSTEQNTFSNFYKHRQEYVEHFKEVRNDFPEHIKGNITEKIIRGYYSSTYPFNNSTSFTVKPNIGWIESFDKGLIELSYILNRMATIDSASLILAIYRELLRQETSIRQGLFDINKLADAAIPLGNSKITFIQYWDGSKFELKICRKLISSCYLRIRDYAEFLRKLKYLADEFEGTMLYGTDAYSCLSTLEHHNKFDKDDYPIVKLFDSNTMNVEFSENQNDELTEIFNEIHASYDRKIRELDAIKEANNEG